MVPLEVSPNSPLDRAAEVVEGTKVAVELEQAEAAHRRNGGGGVGTGGGGGEQERYRCTLAWKGGMVPAGAGSDPGDSAC
jgi:hypothetical protein